MNLIVAVDSEWGIGCGGELLAHIPGDLKYFKETTMDKVVVMGRKTLESLPGKKGLPKRVNFVLTGNPEFEAERPRRWRNTRRKMFLSSAERAFTVGSTNSATSCM